MSVLDRRSFIKGGAALGGSLALSGVHVPLANAVTAFTFGFGSCLGGGNTLRPWVGLDRVPRGAAFFVSQGDLTYSDSSGLPQTYDFYKSQFQKALAHPKMAALRSAMPVHFVQDDHDYGLDDCDRTSYKKYAAQAFHDVIGVPYPEPDWRSWSVNGVDFFLTDNRRYKDPPSGPYENGMWMSVLGTAQRKWLKDGLTASTAPLKVVFAPMTATWYWSTQERRDFVKHCALNVSGKVVLCTGDKHSGADVNLLYGGAPAVVEMFCSPIDNLTKHKTPNRSQSDIQILWRESTVAPDYRGISNMIGIVDVTSTTATLKWVRCGDGVVLHSRVIRFA